MGGSSRRSSVSRKSRRSSTGFRSRRSSRTQTRVSRPSGYRSEFSNRIQCHVNPLGPAPQGYFRSQRRSNACLWIGVVTIIVVTAAAACLGYYFVSRQESNDTKTQHGTTMTENQPATVITDLFKPGKKTDNQKQQKEPSSCCLSSWKWTLLFGGVVSVACYYMGWYPEFSNRTGMTEEEQIFLEKFKTGNKADLWGKRVSAGMNKGAECGRLPQNDFGCWNEAVNHCTKGIPDAPEMAEHRSQCKQMTKLAIAAGINDRLKGNCMGTDPSCLTEEIHKYCDGRSKCIDVVTFDR